MKDSIHQENIDGQENEKLDGRDEIILIVFALITPLAVLPVLLGG